MPIKYEMYQRFKEDNFTMTLLTNHDRDFWAVSIVNIDLHVLHRLKYFDSMFQALDAGRYFIKGFNFHLNQQTKGKQNV